MRTDPSVLPITVDVARDRGIFPRTWQYIGYDECNLTLTPDGRELLAKFGRLARGGPASRENPAHYYVRAHHMLCTGNLQAVAKWGSTNVYTEDADGNPVHDFTVIDRMLDVWLSCGLKPFFEIGFMPRDLADPRFIENGKEYDLGMMGDYRRRGWSAPPKDYGRWYDLVRDLVAHCVGRYGRAEVESWYWELWNEPDIFYWRGTRDEFFRLYDVTEAAVHDALPTAYFGGPATTGTHLPDGNAAQFLDAFLDHVKNGTNHHSGRTGTRVDYLSFHTKGGIYNTTLRREKQLPTIDLFLDNVRVAAAIIRKYGFDHLEIALSEADPDSWAAGGRYDNFNLNFRNTEYFASYIACSYERLYALAEELGMDLRPLAWTFAFDWERLFEGMRTFTTRGVDKAVFNLFKIYARLGERRVGAKALIPIDADGVRTGVWAFRTYDPEDGETVQVLLVRHHDDWDVDTDAELEVRIGGLPFDGLAVARRFRIDAAWSNPYAEWKRQGMPDYPDPEQYRAVKARDGLESPPDLAGVSAGGNLTLRTTLPSHAVELLEIRKA
ncbi:MAG: hypothetical protein KBA30_04680 [Clostridia bacterium]|nr:hypothetical protein [Clostridia bacterium]